MGKTRRLKRGGARLSEANFQAPRRRGYAEGSGSFSVYEGVPGMGGSNIEGWLTRHSERLNEIPGISDADIALLQSIGIQNTIQLIGLVLKIVGRRLSREEQRPGIHLFQITAFLKELGLAHPGYVASGLLQKVQKLLRVSSNTERLYKYGREVNNNNDFEEFYEFSYAPEVQDIANAKTVARDLDIPLMNAMRIVERRHQAHSRRRHALAAFNAAREPAPAAAVPGANAAAGAIPGANAAAGVASNARRQTRRRKN
jgi:hypothetical protein